MAKHVQKTFANITEVLDDNSYEQCTFVTCRLVFNGGGIPSMVECVFTDACEFVFGEAAARTIAFMQAIYHGMGEGGKQTIEATFEHIRLQLAGGISVQT